MATMKALQDLDIFVRTVDSGSLSATARLLEITVRVKSVNVSNDGDAVRRWALLGRGIAYKSFFDVADDLAQGRLQALCTDWTTEAVPLFLVMPGRRQLTPLMRSLRDFVVLRTAALLRAA